MCLHSDVISLFKSNVALSIRMPCVTSYTQVFLLISPNSIWKSTNFSQFFHNLIFPKSTNNIIFSAAHDLQYLSVVKLETIFSFNDFHLCCISFLFSVLFSYLFSVVFLNLWEYHFPPYCIWFRGFMFNNRMKNNNFSLYQRKSKIFMRLVIFFNVIQKNTNHQALRRQITYTFQLHICRINSVVNKIFIIYSCDNEFSNNKYSAK